MIIGPGSHVFIKHVGSGQSPGKGEPVEGGKALRSGFRDWIARRMRGTGPGNEPTDYQGLFATPPNLEAEYRQVAQAQLRRLGLPESAATIAITKASHRLQRPHFVIELAITGWDRDAVIRVLLGLPLLEARMRKCIEPLWIADVSTFVGLKVSAGERLQEADASNELRRLVIELTGERTLGK